MSLTPSNHTPPCPHFGICGGCSLQNLDEAAYQNYKREAISSWCTHNNLKPLHQHPAIFIPSETRRRVTFAARRKGDQFHFGFFLAKTNIIEPIEQCLLLTPALFKTAMSLKNLIAPVLKDNAETDLFLQEIDGDVELIIIGALPKEQTESDRLKKLAVIAEQCGITRIGVQPKEFAPIDTILSYKTILKNFSGLHVPIPIGNFLQPSVAGETALLKIITAHLPSKKFKALDLFAGCGTFTGKMIEKGGQVTGYEIDKQAVSALNQALAAHPKSKAEVRHLLNEPVTPREMKGFDLVALDPPRAGAFEQAKMLARSEIKKIIYVSCNPTSFARDTKILLQSGFIFTDLHVVDQFIWSEHTEIVGIFTRA